MSWRNLFTLVYFVCSSYGCTHTRHRFNKYSQIAARAVRSSLKEEQRVISEKRGVTNLRYQKWENGQGGQQVRLTSIS